MRILYLSPSGQLGGAENSLLDLLATLRVAAPSWQLGLIVASEGPLTVRALALGVDVRSAPFPAELSHVGDSAAASTSDRQIASRTLLLSLAAAVPAAVRYTRALRREIAAYSPDIVHTNGFKMHILGVRACQKRVPVVWHIRDYVTGRPVMARLLRWHARDCAAIITNSSSVAEDVRRVCGNRVQLRVVHNGIDLETFSPAGSTIDLDMLAGLPVAPPSTVRVGLVGTLARWKGHAAFLRAISLMPPGTNVRAYVIGGPLYQTEGSQWTLDELKQAALALNLGDRVGFTGFVSDPAAAIRSLDILVHASIAPEPFGRVIVEGMACGRPVIASRAGGAIEILTEGTDALAHTPGDSEELANCIIRLVHHPELRAALGTAGRLTACARFDRNRLPEAVVPIYRAATIRPDSAIDGSA